MLPRARKSSRRSALNVTSRRKVAGTSRCGTICRAGRRAGQRTIVVLAGDVHVRASLRAHVVCSWSALDFAKYHGAVRGDRRCGLRRRRSLVSTPLLGTALTIWLTELPRSPAAPGINNGLHLIAHSKVCAGNVVLLSIASSGLVCGVGDCESTSPEQLAVTSARLRHIVTS
jgi:hypothetical protein